MVTSFNRLIIPGPAQQTSYDRPAWRSTPASFQQTHLQTNRFPNTRYQQPPQIQAQQQRNYPYLAQQQFRQPQNSYMYNTNTNYRPQAPLNIQKLVVQHPTEQAPASTQSNSQYHQLQQIINAGRYSMMPRSEPPTPQAVKQSRQSEFLTQFIGKTPGTNPHTPQSNTNTQQLLASFTAPRNPAASRGMDKHTVNSYIRALQTLQRQFKQMFPLPTASSSNSNNNMFQQPRQQSQPQPPPQPPQIQPTAPQRPTPPNAPQPMPAWPPKPPQSPAPFQKTQFSKPQEVPYRTAPAPLPPQQQQQQPRLPPQPPQFPPPPRYQSQLEYRPLQPPQKPPPPPARFEPSGGPRPLPPNSASPFVLDPPAPVNKEPAAAAAPAAMPSYQHMQYGECTVAYSRDQLCCDGIMNNKPKQPGTWGCCGTMVFDMSTHICCDKMPVPNPGNRLKCCKKGPFDPSRQMCCGESVKPRPPNRPDVDCCGKHMYNPTTHLCCEEGNTYLRSPTSQCCGKNTFQPAFQQCCFGDAMPKGMTCVAR
ncbi:hypothetical protein EGW08_019572 [Elysia chlorotica]|uniref:Galaxin-like repeats domain-containing protein n=1 Tax=Elysia chlorotica TaxID=188477 RepID=A0A433STQ3_ELYCH|nr:hypothetical protein EGW08_019572 [Elysia chlorotica]